jgi:heme exporter protein A
MISSLTAENLALARGDRTLFEGLSFRVGAGQALAVEGANGAGKSSLLRLIAGFLTPRSGRLILTTQSGEITDPEERGSRIGWLGHHDGLKPQLTAREQLDFFARLYRSVSEPAAVLEDVGLKRQALLPCRFLSAGQKRRLALARLLVSGRSLWLLDEPFAALDVAGQDLVARLMVLHCGAGGIVIAASHDPLGLNNQVLKL